MNEKVISLVNELREDSRRSLTEISCKAGIPLSTAFKMLRRTEGEMIIKNTCLIDFARLGYPLKIGLFLGTGNKRELISLLTNHLNLNSFFRLSGDYDYYAELFFKDLAGFQDFIEEISDIVKKVSVHFVADIEQEVFKIGGVI